MHAHTDCLPPTSAERALRACVEDLESRWTPGNRSAADRRRVAEMLGRWALAVDGTTREHVRRVGTLSGRVARALGWTEREARDLAVAGALHDVGKISLPAHVRDFAGPLAPAEMALARLHASLGGRVLAGVRMPLLVLARDVATGHHERWDGAGYPAGLAGEEIPPGARIVAVADAYDAITRDRPYRARRSRAEALRILADESGRQFDPAVVAAFPGIAVRGAAQ